MSAHTLSLARTLGWCLVVIATLFGVLVLSIPTPNDRAIALVGGLFSAGILLIAGKQVVPLVVKLITAWKAPKP